MNSRFILSIHSTFILDSRAKNSRQGIVMKTSFKTQVLWMGLGSFVDINIFVVKYFFNWFIHILHFFRIKIYTKLRPQKGNSRVSFNDTLLNLGLRAKKVCHELFILILETSINTNMYNKYVKSKMKKEKRFYITLLPHTKIIKLWIK